MEDTTPKTPMGELIDAMVKVFPPKHEGDFNSAIFFHHREDGSLSHCSPLIGDGTKTGETLGIKTLVARLYTYADACKQMADDIVTKTLPQS